MLLTFLQVRFSGIYPFESTTAKLVNCATYSSVYTVAHNECQSVWVGSTGWQVAQGASVLEWDEELAAFAKERAALCHTDAAPQDLSSLRHIGWNTHFSAHGNASFTDTIDSWFAEGQSYSYLTGQCRENTTCQHYTQVHTSILNKYLIQPECKLETRSKAESCSVCVILYFCFYRGNWEVKGQLVMPYKAGLYCSLCTSSMSGCFKLWDHIGGLCEIPRNPCRMSCGQHGRLNISSCKCQCDPGFTGRFCQVRCSVQCIHGHFKEEECSCLCDIGYGGSTFPFTPVTS
uniref:C-type lectin domain family 18 member A n=1 Tax=Sphaeramia orbicularis TaxID=375764 RepID=A0A673AMR6_9TELE